MDQITLAYKKLKQTIYYDNVNLFLRCQIAEFETSNNFQERLDNVQNVITKFIKKGFVKECELLNEWINSISFKCLPKTIKADEEDNNDDGACFLSNIRTKEQYDLEGVNYFIDAPIELYILDIIWCMEVGIQLEEELSSACLGNRLEPLNRDDAQHNSGRLFKIFHRQYSKWRDTAIEKAGKALENDTNVLLIGLDIKQCYYHINTDFDKIEKYFLHDTYKKGLSEIIKKIGKQYHEITKSYFRITNPSAENIKGLPVGLNSSHILTNWMLNRFDTQVMEKLSPLYYGRYVDDILIVLQSLQSDTVADCDTVVDKLFIKNKLLEKHHDKTYSLISLPTLKIQKNKLIIQHFDATHSHAGLKEFSKEIMERASEFRFLPVGDDTQALDDCAYDIIYKGSVNKLRSVVGMEENSTELSKYLSRRIIQYRLCKDGLTDEHLDQLYRFYKGRNIFDYCRLWEKVFTLLITNKKEFQCVKFYNQCTDVIKKLESDKLIQKKVNDDLILYLKYSLAIPLGLMSSKYYEDCESKLLKKLLLRKINNKQNLIDVGLKLRYSNMIRHYFVSYPLLNYTSYDGDLVSPISADFPSVEDWDIREKSKLSPRYIHNDELQLYTILHYLVNTGNHKLKEYMEHYNQLCSDIKHQYELPIKYLKKDMYRVVRCPSLESDKEPKKLIIGIANMKVSEDDIGRAFKANRKQNLSYERQSNLYRILNEAIEKPECDLVVFPELSIPFAWVPTMASFSRRHSIGLIFGVEHIVVNKNAYNYVFTLLPYKDVFDNKGCFISARLKNHYSPSEKNTLRIHGLNSISPDKPYYELFYWQGKAFSVFNCFELTNIAHRGIMQSELDFLVTVAWNRDVIYYDHILASTCRDLHCYVIHSNTSQYGDSRITAPQKQEDMDYVRVKGGISPVLLKAKLDIDELRDFQIKKYDPSDTRFKPTPAGYDREKVLRRTK